MQLTRLARDTVDKLLTETGHTLSVDDVAHIVNLNALAVRISHPYKADDIDLVEMPRAVGGVVLHPLTLGAWQWLDSFALPLLDGHWLSDIAVPYAMAYSKNPTRLREDCTKRQLVHSLRGWVRGLKCTASELMRTVDLMRVGSGDVDTGDETGKFGPVIAALCKEYGGTPEYWAWGAPADTVRVMLDHMAKNAEAEIAAASRASTKSGTRTQTTPQSKIDAHKRFRRYEQALRQRWQKM